jgi:hypothetical protein
MAEDPEAREEEGTILIAEGMAVVAPTQEEEEGSVQAGMAAAEDTEEEATVAVADVGMSLGMNRMADILARGKVAVRVLPKKYVCARCLF